MNSCRKGKVGEREAAELLRSCGIAARRGQQHAGGEDSPDIVTELDCLHVEVKRTETLQLYPALDQAEHDASVFQIPVVLHRRNGKKWVAILAANVFLGLLKRAVAGEAKSG